MNEASPAFRAALLKPAAGIFPPALGLHRPQWRAYSTAKVGSLSSSLMLNFVSAVNGLYTFSYTLNNTSTLDSRVTAFGFNTDPDSLLTILTGSVFTQSAPGSNFPNTIGVREECVTTGNCTGGGGGGAGVDDGGFTTGSFSLSVGNANVATLALTDFAVRYQGIPVGAGSGTGTVTAAVPEPGTWAMMLLGFGAIGVAMRRRRSSHISQFA
jgi:hypothetical protein